MLLAASLYLNWQLGLVMLACVPFIGLSVASLSMLMSSSATEGTNHYSNAGGVATEVNYVFGFEICACENIPDNKNSFLALYSSTTSFLPNLDRHRSLKHCGDLPPSYISMAAGVCRRYRNNLGVY